MSEYEGGEVSFFGRLAEQFNEGGWVMYPVTLACLALPVLATVLLVTGLVKPRHALALGGALVAAVVGMLGLVVIARMQGMRGVEEAIVHASPEDRDTIRMGSEAELAVPMIWALRGAVLPIIAGFTLLGRGLAQQLGFDAPKA
jgi:hypothetical protein